MFTLIAIGVGAAYAFSAVAMLFPRHFPRCLPSHTARSAIYFEAAAVITVLVLLGQVLELRARSRTGSAIQALLDLAPQDRPASFAKGGRGCAARCRASRATCCGCVRARKFRWTAK